MKTLVVNCMKTQLTGFIKTIENHVKKLSHRYDRNVVFSIGENCLTDGILARNHLKSFSSPYASGRSNIEYVLAFEKYDFSDFIDPDYLRYEDFSGKTVVRNKKYIETRNKYHSTVTNGFEFTHHDVLGNKRARQTIQRRCSRLIQLNGKNIVMVYHHRLCSGTDMDMLAGHLSELSQIYENRKNTVHLFAFTQTLVPDKKSRRVVKHLINGIHFYDFHTLNEWEGHDDDVFWARCDDDLLAEMIDDIRKMLI